MTQQSDEEVTLEISVENLWKEVKVGYKCSLQNNWNVWGVEQFDWVWSESSSDFVIFDWNINLESLEIDHNQEDQNSGQKICQIGEWISENSWLEGSYLVFSN